MEEKDFGKCFQHLSFPKSRISGPGFQGAGFWGLLCSGGGRGSGGRGDGLLYLEQYITDLIRPSQ